MRVWLPPRRPDPRRREELLALLEAPAPQVDSVLRRLQEIARQERIPVHSLLLGLILHTDLSEEEASRHWKLLCAHREELRKRLGRDPGVRVAALDFFSSREPLLANAVLVDGAQADRSLRSAWKDGLTGLISPRHLRDLLKREVRRSLRRSLDFSLVLLDLDDFRRVNQNHGRRGGDWALKEVAVILGARLRDADASIRTGGAGFALVLPGTRRAGAYVVSERIRAAVEERFRQQGPGGRRLLLTLSAGVACFPADGRTPEDLLERAAQAAALARRAGGNGVVLHYRESRQGARFRPLGENLALQGISRGRREPVELKAVDFSGSGALLESGTPFRIGEDLELGFSGLAPLSGLVVPARVERQWAAGSGTGRFRLGVRFLAEQSGQREALENLLARLRARGVEEGDS